ncbi:MAG: restriction endonuclease [Phycisphaerales bacterium]
MTLWLTRSGRHGEHEQKFLDEGRVYLTWRELDCDLSALRDRSEVLDLLRRTYPAFKEGHRRQHAGQIWTFVGRMEVDDWVAMPSKHKTIHIGKIKSPYRYVGGESVYRHYREVEWIETDIPRTNFDQDILNSLGAFTTICQIKRNDAEERVRAMQANDWKATTIKPKIPPHNGVNDDEGEDNDDASIDLELIARDQIARKIQSTFAGHGMEDLVEAILRAQGFTTHHSQKGPDGGIDILAAPDTLGFGTPRICVQVKSQASPLERVVLDQLVGTMQHVGADQGLLVCWGGFKKTILHEAPRLFFKVRLWDQNDLIDHFLAVYDRLDEDLRAEIPLKRVWAIALPEESDEVDGE